MDTLLHKPSRCNDVTVITNSYRWTHIWIFHLGFFSHHAGAGHHLGIRRDFDVRAFLPATTVTSDSSTASALMFAHAGEKIWKK